MSKKTEKKQQEKIIQDRTFGLKNKNKSKQVQKFCQGVAQQVKHSGVSMNRIQSEEYEKKKALKQKEEEERLIASLYRDVQNAQEEEEEEEEVDPKSVLCEYFKQGLCQKGKKCIYSHDMSLEQKTQILDIYTDQREQLGDDWDTCQNWDDKTLTDVVEANAKKYKCQIPSEKVCDYFLDALEKNKYGWRWVCPNGMTCQYKHCLPQGYVLKKKGEDKQINALNIEDQIDEQREKLEGGKGTKITKDVFLQWKADRAKRKQQEDQKKQDEQKKKGQKQNNNFTGRALFVYDPTLFVDDEEAANDYERQEMQEEEEEDDGQMQQEDNDNNDQDDGNQFQQQ